MYTIAFDLKIDDLKKSYVEPYSNAYDEIKRELAEFGFQWTQGSLYMSNTKENTLVTVFEAINRLKEIDWFVESLRDIRAFKVEDWSDFTETVKKSKKK
jgi:virulence-associated protein VapD